MSFIFHIYSTGMDRWQCYTARDKHISGISRLQLQASDSFRIVVDIAGHVALIYQRNGNSSQSPGSIVSGCIVTL